jgi:hypothetical protein
MPAQAAKDPAPEGRLDCNMARSPVQRANMAVHPVEMPVQARQLDCNRDRLSAQPVQ